MGKLILVLPLFFLFRFLSTYSLEYLILRWTIDVKLLCVHILWSWESWRSICHKPQGNLSSIVPPCTPKFDHRMLIFFFFYQSIFVCHPSEIILVKWIKISVINKVFFKYSTFDFQTKLILRVLSVVDK